MDMDTLLRSAIMTTYAKSVAKRVIRKQVVPRHRSHVLIVEEPGEVATNMQLGVWIVLSIRDT